MHFTQFLAAAAAAAAALPAEQQAPAASRWGMMGGGMGMPMSMGGMGMMPIGMGGMGMGGMGMPMVIPLGMGGMGGGGAGGMADYMKTLSELLKQQGGGGGDRMDLDECSEQEPKFQARKHTKTLTFQTKIFVFHLCRAALLTSSPCKW